MITSFSHKLAFCLLAVALLASTHGIGQIIPINPPKNNKPQQLPTQKPAEIKREKTPRTGNHIFTFKLSGALNYYMPDIGGGGGNKFDSRVLSGQVSSMLGVRYGTGDKASAAGVFFTYGAYSSAASALVNTNPLVTAQKGNFWEAEGGIIVYEFLRLSAGYGSATLYQDINKTLKISQDDYFTGTLGLCLGPKNVKFEALGTFLFSQIQNRISFRPSVGIAVKLDFFRKRE